MEQSTDTNNNNNSDNIMTSVNNSNLNNLECTEININQDIDTIYNFLLDELFNVLDKNEEIIIPDKDERLTKPDLEFNKHKRTVWKNFKENLKQICKEEIFLTIKSILYSNTQSEINNLHELVHSIDCINKNELKKVNELLDIKISQIVNKKINKIFGKKEVVLIEQAEFDNLVFPNSDINNLINLIYQKNMDFVFSTDPNTKNSIDLTINEILTRREVSIFKFFESEYKKFPSISGEDHFLIPGRFVNMLPNTIKKYIRLYSQCNICKSIKTVIIKNYNMSIDYKSCSKCKSKTPIIKSK